MEGDTLSDFIDDVCGESRLRVEDDLGDGFVRLRSSEAERRQAAQDIRSSEDVVIELLRNARDAGASRIFLATQRTGNARLLTVLDDGQGIPAAQHERIFEPRVTSKLDSAHMDKWGMHGRGMALYSISVNAEEARVLQSEPGLGTSLTVATDTESLAEKADQSTFPRFEQEPSGSWAMRGPKNIVRTAAEFALEHRGDLSVYLGTPVEVAATLYQLGLASLSPAVRAFGGDGAGIPLVKRLALAAFFGFHSAEGAWGVYETDNRPVEFFGLFHQTQGFAVALRGRHAEIAADVFFRIRAFRLGDDRDRCAVKRCNTADDRRIIAIQSITMKLNKIRKQLPNIIFSHRSVLFPRFLHTVPSRCFLSRFWCCQRPLHVSIPQSQHFRGNFDIFPMHPQNLRQHLFRLFSWQNPIHKPMLHQKLRPLEPFRQFLSYCLLNNPRSRKPDQRMRLRQNNIPQHGKAGCNTTGCGVCKNRDIELSRIMMSF